jgi:hypothetical protein
MKLLSKQGSAAIDIDANAMNADECRLKRLIDRLPNGLRSTIRFLRQPSGRWLRIPMGGIADVWRAARLPAGRGILDASDRLGTPRR